MDKRIEKTKRSIVNAFLELRSRKAIEKITVKELCEKAEINKSTFYTHFKDIYDLSEQLEIQTANEIISGLRHPEYLFSKPDIFTRELFYAYTAQGHLIHTLFSGSRANMLLVRTENCLKESSFPCGLITEKTLLQMYCSPIPSTAAFTPSNIAAALERTPSLTCCRKSTGRSWSCCDGICSEGCVNNREM